MARPRRFKVAPPEAGSASQTSSNGSDHVSMPPTHGPEHASSESDSSDDDDVPPTSSETTASKKKSYWIVSLIDEGGTITEGRLKVRDIWSLPMGKRIIIPCNELGQPIDDAGGLLGGFMGDLGSDFSKFPMCYKSWRKVPVNYKNNVYDDIIQKKILVEDGRLRDYMMKSIGKTWKNTRCSLYHRFYKESLTFEENVARRPGGIDLDQWTWFLQYRKDKKTQKMCKQNAENRRKQTYTHTNGSKSLPRRKAEEERKHGRPMSRGELWPLTHKRKDSTYMNEAAKLIGEQIERIESQDGVSKKISEFDSLAQVLGKEHAGRVRGVDFGPTTTQVFGQTTYQFNGVSSTQANRDHEMEEMKLKMQELQSVVESERSRRRALENFLTRYIVQQGMELPAELADMGSAATASNRPRPSSSSKC
ncbi:uncharacterized protein LOC132631732 [Lycium barbarum]|uniref:uncharacterized protein LOC132631732 n=1 Tax=Lycium barbarum TaxID=112863 RepID=UPI00293E95D8|nr:uncharacterized protein LOC132631732 [Lycium barbarum]XP_060203413.1 uncharacterized protein LOC132631732 [Lycium barbarum]